MRRPVTCHEVFEIEECPLLFPRWPVSSVPRVTPRHQQIPELIEELLVGNDHVYIGIFAHKCPGMCWVEAVPQPATPDDRDRLARNPQLPREMRAQQVIISRVLLKKEWGACEDVLLHELGCSVGATDLRNQVCVRNGHLGQEIEPFPT